MNIEDIKIIKDFCNRYNLDEPGDIENVKLDDMFWLYEMPFYTSNLNSFTRASLVQQATRNLLNDYSAKEILQVTNFDEMGIVEYVAEGYYHIENNKIIGED